MPFFRRMHTLKSVPKTSPFIQKLKAEPEIPTIKDALKLYQSDSSDKTSKFNHPRELKSGAFQFTIPTPRKEYKHLLTSPKALESLSLAQSQAQDPDFQKLVSGEAFIATDKIFPYSQAYAGFQFGQFAGQLGDGRVINLFQVTNDSGEKYELQIKGAGKTAFSRFADGKAVLRSSIREFIISESLNGIGIPTARALSITALPGTLAQREYAETCAVVSRFAKSWIRIGTFDYYRYKRDRVGLRMLADYIIEEVLDGKLPRFEPGAYKFDKHKELTEGSDEQLPENFLEINDSTKYEQLYRAIVRRNAETVAYWQVYGFMNGVLNTDNTSVIGLSLDFGPFSFLDKFDPDFTPNHDDVQLRYAFGNQPTAIWWNLTRLGESLAELLGAGPELINDNFFVEQGVKKEWGDRVLKRASSVIHLASNEYKSVFMEHYNDLFGRRLGLRSFLDGDDDLYAELLKVLLKTQIDYNTFFLNLQTDAKLDSVIPFLSVELLQRFNNPEDKIDQERNEEIQNSIEEWLKVYRDRLLKENITYNERYEIASKVNPLFVPRNWILEDVIQYLQNDLDGNRPYLEKLLKMGSNPYDKSKWGEELKELEIKWLINEDEKTMKQCSCSS